MFRIMDFLSKPEQNIKPQCIFEIKKAELVLTREVRGEASESVISTF